MKKNLTGKILMLVSALVFASMLSNGVFAYVDAEITAQPFSLSTCPCGTLNAKHVNAYIENKGSSGTYKLSLVLPDSWSGFIKPDIYLKNSEKKKISPIWITAGCGSKPGVKKIKIKATKESKTFTKSLDVSVLKCHYFDLSAPKKVDICDGKSKKVDLKIKNEGRFEERVKLSSNKDWASLADETVTIAKKSSKTIPAVLDPKQSGSVRITAESTKSYADASMEMDVGVNKCYDFSADLRPEEEMICLKESSKRKLVIENKGTREDNYTILSPEWLDIGIDHVNLKPGKTGKISFSITPDEIGRKDFYFKLVSDKSGDEERLDGMVKANECRDVAVITTPSKKTTCKGETVQYEVMVKNSGNVKETYRLETSLGTLEQDKVTLGPSEAKKLTLSINTSSLSPQSREIVVRAYKDDISDTSRMNLEVNDCYSARLNIEPQVQKVCQCDNLNFTVNVKNTGKYEDTYTLKYGGNEKEFTLKPNEEKEYLYNFTTMYKPDTKKQIGVKLHSEEISMEKNATIKMKPSSECYSVDLRTGENFSCCEMKAPRCGASVVPLKIENRGVRPDTYSLKVIGPEWVHLEKSKTSLGVGENETVYLYVSPPFKTKPDKYSVDLVAESRKAKNKLTMDIEVTGNGTATIEEEGTTTTLKVEEPKGENETGIENVTANKTETNKTPTGEVVGKEETKMWQKVVFFAILIVVIAILGYIIFS